MRDVVRASTQLTRFEPGRSAAWQEGLERFAALHPS
jgi:hypothetical protein